MQDYVYWNNSILRKNMIQATYSSLSEQIGQEIGISDWTEITQHDIDQFGHATRDVEPLHMDPDWCLTNSPYGKPIAYGFQTLAFLTYFMHNATGDIFCGTEETQNFPLNYGFDKIRLLNPVSVNSFIRARFELMSVSEKRPGELLLKLMTTVEIKNQERPAMIAEWLVLWVTEEGHSSVTRVQS